MRIPQSWSKARLTFVVFAVTVAAWLIAVTLQLEEWAVAWGSFIPGRLTFGDQAVALAYGLASPPFAPFWLTPLTMTLVHAGVIHLLFNILILIVCGRPVESVLGPFGLAVLYLLGAYSAAIAEYLVSPASLNPTVGASGAMSALLGAYALLFGRNKVKVRNPRVAIWLNALWLLAAWVALNLIMRVVAGGGAIPGLGSVQVAIAAHIGGFLIGIALAWPLLMLRYRKA